MTTKPTCPTCGRKLPGPARKKRTTYHLTEPQKAEMLTKRLAGATAREIAESVGLPVYIIRPVLVGAGLNRIKLSCHGLTKVDRNAQICAMRQEGKTLELIGAAFGMSRQCADIICKRGNAYPPPMPPKPQQWPIRGFRYAMYRHLRSIGLRYCCICKTWMDTKLFGPCLKVVVCRECNRKRCNAHYHANLKERRAAAVAWQRANRDKCTEYARRWLAKRKLKEGGAAC
jgi:hypothetical protein